jgi:L-malate glycosyltransferase
MKQVLIMYRFLPQYRVDFYNRLKDILIKNDIELNLVYGKSKNEDALKKDEVDIEWAQYIPYKQIKIRDIILVWQPYFKQLKNMDLVIVESANKLILNYYLMAARHFSKFKLAFWGHGRNMQIDRNSVRNRFKNLFINKCDWWFAYTEGVKNQLMKKKFPEDKITAVQNAIDTIDLQKYYKEISQPEIDQLKHNLGITGDNTCIFCSGMYPEKRLDFILDTCRRVKELIPDFHMIFIGSGIESDKIYKASQTYDWIHFVGPKFGRERVIYFKTSKIQLMPGLVGLGILDSFAMECPIITTNFPYHSPEIDYLKSGYNGILTENDISVYTQTVVSVLKEKIYLSLLEGCKESANRYTVNNMVENFSNGIISCLN